MARFRISYDITFSDDALGERTLFKRDLRDDEVTDEFAVGSVRTIKVGFGQTIVVSLDGLTNIRFLYVESAKRVNMILNGGAPLPIAPRVGITAGVSIPGRFMVFTEDGVDSLSLVNPGAAAADDATVTVVLGGA